MLARESHSSHDLPMRRPFSALLVATFAFSLLGAAAHAATWVLANGDRLNGRLVEENAAAIVIEHPQLGRLTVPRASLQGTITESTATPPAAATSSTAPATPSAKTAATASTSAAADRAGTRNKWTRQIEIGFVMQEGAKSTRDLNARFQTEGRFAGNSVRATAKVTRAESQGIVTRDRNEADLRIRRDFNRRTFAQALTTYSSDDLRRIDLSVEQQLGGGYRLVDATRQKMNVGLGAVLQRFERKGYEDQTALLGSAFQDYALTWSDQVKFTQESSVQFADRAPVIARTGASSATTLNAPKDGSYRFKFNAALQSKMTNSLSLNLRYEYDYDASIAETELRADSRLTTSLGYAW